jgi:DNA-binding transcriptional LysR family regulator
VGRCPRPMGSPTGIELRHLRYFLAVIEELHFGRAAERLHIAQPPLSQAIRKIEDGLGVELLHRTSRVVAPTEAGRVFAYEARTVLAKFERAVAEARQVGGLGSPLRFGCSLNFPLELMQRLLEALQERAPALQVEVAHLRGLEQVSRLRSGELDVGIFPYAQDHEGIETESLFAGEPMAAFLPPDHRLTDKDILGPEDLLQEVLVTFPRELNPALHEWLIGQLQGAGYRFANVREASGADPRDSMLAVVEGFGVVLGTMRFAEVGEARNLVERRQLDPPLAMPDIVVAWRANPPAHLREALDALRDAASSLGRQAAADGPGS